MADQPLTIADNTVRGRIRSWLQEQADCLESVVLDLGSKTTLNRWFAVNRTLRPDLEWVGVDQEEGFNVDAVADAEHLPYSDGYFGSAVCSEMLEHAWDPRAVLSELARVVRPGGVVLLTTLFAFPYHAYPDDYWRFSESCLARLGREAGFRRADTWQDGRFKLPLSDHGEPAREYELYSHVFARFIL